jgi:Cu(I)/Ag(I) efflux system membrane fusion protein
MKMTQAKSFWGNRKFKTIVLGVLGLAIFLAGYFVSSLLQAPPAGPEHPPGFLAKARRGASEQTVAQKWYCSMDTQIIRNGPGKCPLCGMDLIPMPTESVAGPRELVVSEEAAKLMEIETSTVERKFVTAEVRMVGKVDYDETRVKIRGFYRHHGQ